MRELDNLVLTGDLAKEARDKTEIRGLLKSARNRLDDAAKSERLREQAVPMAGTAT